MPKQDSLEELEAKLARFEGSGCLVVDSGTEAEHWVRALALILGVISFSGWLGLMVGSLASIFVAIGFSLLTFLLTRFNERWIVDFERRRLRLERNFPPLRMSRTRIDIPFEDIAELAVDNVRYRSSHSSKTQVEYGITLMTKDEQFHHLCPRLSITFKRVRSTAARLAELLDVPLQNPKPVSSEEQAKSRSERDEPSSPSEVTVGEHRFELVYHQDVFKQRRFFLIIGALATFLVFAIPVMDSEPENDKSLAGVPLLVAVCCGYWAWNPLAKATYFADRHQGIGLAKEKANGKSTVVAVREFPPGGKVVLEERPDGLKVQWRLNPKTIDGTSVFLLPNLESRAQADRIGRKMASALGATFEIDSSFTEEAAPGS